jgi:uncharacterized protein
VLKVIRSTFGPAMAAGLALLVAALPAEGARVDGLYQAEATLANDRDGAFREALGKVLVRITGRRDAADRPEVAELLNNAATYAQQFRQPAPDRLWAAFDGAALERELARLGQPVWGPERPSTLLWIAVDAGGGRRFVVASGAESPDEAAIRTQVMAAAAERGIPVVFPLMDAEDRSLASFAEVWGGFEDSILAASERYGVDAVLVGRLTANDMGHGRWTLYGADGAERWSGGGPDSVGRLADRFAARFAVATSGADRTMRVAVSGVETVEDYGRVSVFLGGLTAIDSIGVETVERDQVVFRVTMRGEAATLDEAVRLGGVLRPAGGEHPYDLNYRVAR